MEDFERHERAEEALDFIREQHLIDSMTRASSRTGQAIRKSYETYPYVHGKHVPQGPIDFDVWHEGFPESAPKDRPILVSGIWKPTPYHEEQLPGGQEIVLITRWSTLYSNGKGHDWLIDGTIGARLSTYNVNWTHWTELPTRYARKSEHSSDPVGA